MEIIIPHINTDLDALGAAVGAQVLYPQAVIVLPGTLNQKAGEFISLHRYNLRVRGVRDIDPKAVTRAIVVDTAAPARLGPLRDVAGRVEVHLYDHHPPQPDDLTATLEVRGAVGATCTLLAELIEESGAPVTPVQATAMLLGIYADTGSLSLLGTTDRDARAAAFLLARGANLRAMTQFIQSGLSPAQQSLLMQLQERSRWVTVRGARIRLIEGVTDAYVGGLALVIHRLMEMSPAPALFAAVRMDDRVHLVGRSEVPWVNVATVIEAFGGGGHPTAASAVVKGAQPGDVLAKVEELLAQVVQRPPMAGDVMSSPVKSILQEKPVDEAARLMWRHGHSGLPVTDDAGNLQGIVSLRDVEKARRHGLTHAKVSGIMVRKVFTVTPDTPIDAIQALMLERDIGRVPVVEEGRLVGIVSRSDLLGLIYGGPPPRWHRTLYARSPQVGRDDPAEAQVAQGLARLPEPVRALLKAVGAEAARQGVTAFVVGGYVRDLLLGRPNLDMDIVVEGDGIAFAQALGAALGGRVKEVRRFGTAHIYLDDRRPGMPTHLDVATARREYYEHAAALPVVELAGLREDLYRRDFSINAMALRLGPDGPNGLVDFFGGVRDLSAGAIRVLHTLSFVEDPTRILRAVRFAHRYGFHLDPESLELARQAVHDRFLDQVSIERLRTELLLILQEPRSGGALRQLDELGVLAHLVPDVSLDDDLTALIDRVDQPEAGAESLWVAAEPWVAKLAVLLHRLPPEEGVLRVARLKLKREEAGRLQLVLSDWRGALQAVSVPDPSPAAVVAALEALPPEGLLLLTLLGAGGQVAQFWQSWRKVKLAITGKDLIAAGVPAGPAVGRILKRVLADRLAGLAPNRERQLQRALLYLHEEA